MKLQIIIFLLFFWGVFQTEKVEGKYHDNFGSTLILNSDSTFVYTWGFHTSYLWSKGKWKKKKNEITLIVIPIYDTIRVTGHKDSLRLSCNEKPNLISAKSYEDILYPKCYGEQTVNIFKKLHHKKKKLFELDNKGRLITKKRKGYRGNVQYDPWFTKTE